MARCCAVALLAATAGAAHAVPILQLYVEGATYDHDHESWVFEAAADETIRLWVIGNVDGGGGKGTIFDAKIAFSYADEIDGKDLDITVSGTRIGGDGTFMGFTDPSTADDGVFNQFNEDGDLPQLGDGSSLPNHGTYGDGWEWQEFLIGDLSLTDAPVADFFNAFPTSGIAADAGQINAYDIAFDAPDGRISADVHIDAYNHVEGKRKARYVFAPFSHDAGTGINHPVPAPAPIGLLILGALALVARRRARGLAES